MQFAVARGSQSYASLTMFLQTLKMQIQNVAGLQFIALHFKHLQEFLVMAEVPGLKIYHRAFIR